VIYGDLRRRGASPALIAKLGKLASRRGSSLTYSAGWELGERGRGAVKLVPETACLLPETPLEPGTAVMRAFRTCQSGAWSS
jgi:hypothetical protein